jgi:hypothetical protein
MGCSRPIRRIRANPVPAGDRGCQACAKPPSRRKPRVPRRPDRGSTGVCPHGPMRRGPMAGPVTSQRMLNRLEYSYIAIMRAVVRFCMPHSARQVVRHAAVSRLCRSTGSLIVDCWRQASARSFSLGEARRVRGLVSRSVTAEVIGNATLPPLDAAGAPLRPSAEPAQNG